jgi:hypothetical protein
MVESAGPAVSFLYEVCRPICRHLRCRVACTRLADRGSPRWREALRTDGSPVPGPAFCVRNLIGVFSRDYGRMTSRALGLATLLLAACARPPQAPVQDLRGRENLSAYKLQQVLGTRDGDRLDAQARFSDGTANLIVDLHFAVGAPTKLTSGQWRWTAARTGTVAERSVMFLGGQSGPPSLGGRYDLLDTNGVAAYRITIPTTVLTKKLPGVLR